MMQGQCPVPCNHTVVCQTLKQLLAMGLHRAHEHLGELKQGDRAEDHTGRGSEGQHPACKMRRGAGS